MAMQPNYDLPYGRPEGSVDGTRTHDSESTSTLTIRSLPKFHFFGPRSKRQRHRSPCFWRSDIRGFIRFSESLLAVALVNVAVWVVKLCLLCCGFSLPLLSAFYHVLSGLWMFCVNTQASSDLTDPQHLSPRPWYLERSCSGLSDQDANVCRHGKAAFVMAVVCM